VSTVSALIQRIQSTPGCSLVAPRGLPVLEPGHVLPSDLSEFYGLCGGATLFGEAPYSAAVLPPERCVPANPVIVGDSSEDDISASWYLLVDDGNRNYLSIDLHPQRLGRCYESFFDTHGVAGSCPVVAMSFESLLGQLLNNNGRHWFWMQPEFEPLGDAYD
jgi:hypothetical protein